MVMMMSMMIIITTTKEVLSHTHTSIFKSHIEEVMLYFATVNKWCSQLFSSLQSSLKNKVVHYTPSLLQCLLYNNLSFLYLDFFLIFNLLFIHYNYVSYFTLFAFNNYILQFYSTAATS